MDDNPDASSGSEFQGVVIGSRRTMTRLMTRMMTKVMMTMQPPCAVVVSLEV